MRVICIIGSLLLCSRLCTVNCSWVTWRLEFNDNWKTSCGLTASRPHSRTLWSKTGHYSIGWLRLALGFTWGLFKTLEYILMFHSSSKSRVPPVAASSIHSSRCERSEWIRRGGVPYIHFIHPQITSYAKGYELTLCFFFLNFFSRNSVRNLYCTTPKSKQTWKSVPPKSAVYYIIQNSMVHIGDLLRYRGSFLEALKM